MIAPEVQQLLEHCPFLEPYVRDDMDLPVLAFGSVARIIINNNGLSDDEEDRVFAYFNKLASIGTPRDLDVLGTGAVELFNDDEASQRLARTKLDGAALQMLEDFRQGWGQPDYSRAQ